MSQEELRGEFNDQGIVDPDEAALLELEILGILELPIDQNNKAPHNNSPLHILQQRPSPQED
jgi:hypothetical protein